MGRGEFLKDPLTGAQPMFIMDDLVDGVIWQYVRFDGSKAAFTDGNGVPCILGHRNSHTQVKDCVFRNSIDVGVKLRQTYDLEVSGCRFDNIGENGVETRWYENDPRTSQPWEGALPDRGTVNVHDNYFRGIGRLEDSESGLVDGCAFTADNGQTSRDVRAIAFRNNTIEDCLRGFYSENNPPFLPTRSVDASHNHFIGRVLSGSPYVKQGIGLINVEGFVVEGNTYDNWGNHDPWESSCDAIVLSGDSRKGVVALNPILERRTSGHRMDKGIHLAHASDVTVFGNPLNGATDGHIVMDPAQCSNIRIFANPGAAQEMSWGDTYEVEFHLETLAPGTFLSHLRPSGWCADANTPNTSKGALVAASYRLTGSVTAGTLTISPYVSGSAISGLAVNQSEFVGQYAEKKSSIGPAPMIDNMAGLAVRYSTSASFTAGGAGAYVKLVFDRSRKL
jgi:hypothetical protein